LIIFIKQVVLFSSQEKDLMKYIVLLRKINVGKENRISMKILEEVFVSLGYKDVETYFNSGNVNTARHLANISVC